METGKEIWRCLYILLFCVRSEVLIAWLRAVWLQFTDDRLTNKKMPLVIYLWRLSPQPPRHSPAILHKTVDNSLHNGWVWRRNCAGATPKKRRPQAMHREYIKTSNTYCSCYRRYHVIAKEMVGLLRVMNGYAFDRMRPLRIQRYFPDNRKQSLKYTTDSTCCSDCRCHGDPS